MPAEAEGVVDDGVDFHFARGVGNVIQIAFGVGRSGRLIVGGTMPCLMASAHRRSFPPAPAAPSKVAGRAFGGTDGNLFRVFAENSLDGLRFREYRRTGVEVPWALM